MNKISDDILCEVKYCMMTIVPILKVFRENKIT